jgi:hypothetical protein
MGNLPDLLAKALLTFAVAGACTTVLFLIAVVYRSLLSVRVLGPGPEGEAPSRRLDDAKYGGLQALN